MLEIFSDFRVGQCAFPLFIFNATIYPSWLVYTHHSIFQPDYCVQFVAVCPHCVHVLGQYSYLNLLKTPEEVRYSGILKKFIRGILT